MQQLWDIPQQVLLTALQNKKLTPEQYYEIFHKLNHLWIRPGTNSCSALYGNIAFERPVKEIVEEEKNACEKYLKEVFEKLPWIEEIGIKFQDQQQAIQDLHEHLESSLPNQVLHPQQDSEQTTEIEQEVQTEREAQLDVQRDMSDENVNLYRGTYSNYFFDSEKILKQGPGPVRCPLKNYFEQRKELAHYAEAFGDLHFTTNVLAWTSESLGDLFGIYRTPLHFVTIDKDKVTLLSQGDAIHMTEDKGLYNLTTGFLKKQNDPPLAVRKKLVKVKFLNGESHYSAKESRLLKEWLEEHDAKMMHSLYTEHILSGYPEKAVAYQRSQLKQIFNELTGS